MMLSVRVYKLRKSDGQPIYDVKRYPSFDTLAKGDSFEEKFNNAFDVLVNEIYEDRKHNEMDKYGQINICDVFII